MEKTQNYMNSKGERTKKLGDKFRTKICPKFLNLYVTLYQLTLTYNVVD